MILVSSCLGGIECRYNGSHAASEKIRKLIEEKQAVMACPELLGGFSTPREPAEIIGGTGEDVLNGCANIYEGRGPNIGLCKNNQRLCRHIERKRPIMR